MCRFQRLPQNRRRFGLLIGIGMLAVAAGVWAANLSLPPHEQFFLGNKAYSQGRFGDAVAHYRAVARTEGVSVPLLFNMGNAYQRTGNTGQAIVSYERALLLDPGNEDVRANLAKVRKDLGLFEETPPSWVRFFGSLSVDAWAWLGSGAFSLLGLLFLIRGLVPFLERRYRVAKLPAFFPFRALVTLLLFAMAVSAAGVWTQFGDRDRAVVIQPDVQLLVSPFESADSVTRIKAGRTVDVLKQFGRYAYVRTKGGQKGWVSRAAVERIVPRRREDHTANVGEEQVLSQNPVDVTVPGSSS